MEKSSLINELTQGKELTERLMHHLNPTFSSLQTRQCLVEKILSSYDKALSLLNLSANFHVQHKPNICSSESLHPIHDSSPRSDVCDQDFKDQSQKNVSRKRKTQQRWTEQIKECSGTGLEGPLDDGYNWRKYGQKDILGANYPRGYYRCTHRHSQGCLAVKQVQRSDKDPSIFEVTYRGRHTCVQASDHLGIISSVSDIGKQKKPRYDQEKSVSPSPLPTAEMFSGLEEGVVVKTESLDSRGEVFPSFSFPDASINEKNEENNLVGSVCPAFISPATSVSNYFSTSSGQFDDFGIGYYNMQTPESELTEIGSIPTSVTNSPIGNFDFSNLDFEINFQFDNLEFEFLA